MKGRVAANDEPVLPAAVWFPAWEADCNASALVARRPKEGEPEPEAKLDETLRLVDDFNLRELLARCEAEGARKADGKHLVLLLSDGEP